MLPLKRIICPTDFSEPSFKALQVACEFALQFESQLLLLHVVEPPKVVPMPEAVTTARLADLTEEMESWARESIEKARRDRVPGTVKSSGLVRHGDPAGEIVKLAEEQNADLTVIATHGHTGFRRFIAGSVAEKVARHTTRPVLIVQMPEAKKAGGEKGEPS